MEANTQRVSPAVVAFLGAAGLLFFVALAWFMVIAPKRAEAADLESQIAANRVLLAGPLQKPAAAKVDPDEQMERLAVAVPETVQMPAVVLELNRVAERAMVRLDQLAPGAPVTQAGFQSQPIAVTLQGTFFAISDFVRLLRAEADIRDGAIAGSGRIYSVDSLTFAEGESKYPILTATVSISTVFGAVAVQPQGGATDDVPAEPSPAAGS